jgi:hypothetical protein
MARLSLAERFWAKVRKTDSCWEWTGGRTLAGYGIVYVGKRMKLAHRVAWELSSGQTLLSSEFVLQDCDNPPCVRPDHLKKRTKVQNFVDAVNRGRRRGPFARVLDADTVRAIIIVASEQKTMTQKELGARFGVSASTISRIATGKRYRWMFPEYRHFRGSLVAL